MTDNTRNQHQLPGDLEFKLPKDTDFQAKTMPEKLQASIAAVTTTAEDLGKATEEYLKRTHPEQVECLKQSKDQEAVDNKAMLEEVSEVLNQAAASFQQSVKQKANATSATMKKITDKIAAGMEQQGVYDSAKNVCTVALEATNATVDTLKKGTHAMAATLADPKNQAVEEDKEDPTPRNSVMDGSFPVFVKESEKVIRLTDENENEEEVTPGDVEDLGIPADATNESEQNKRYSKDGARAQQVWQHSNAN